ncbi:MAG: DNA polymerase I [Bacilli bacterium]|nr:DNA polymerase I [Bacilli bacterium]MDD4063459.1 DNA polymerase I [Bacilli bacterium]
MKKITLVDGNSLMFRAYYATAYTGNLMQNSQGLFTNAIFGFVNMMNSLIESKDIEYLFVAFDAGKETFRHKEYTEYKGTRSKLPEELRMQIPYVKEYLDTLGIKRFEAIYYEADDLIASVARKTFDEFDEINIVTGDKDLLQLVNEKTRVFLTKSGVKDLDENNINNFFNKHDITPIQVPDYKGLVGDPSDNLPGINGVGDKTAKKLLNKYTTIEGIYENIHDLKGKLKEKIIEGQEIANTCKRLATLRYDAEIPYKTSELYFDYLNNSKLIELYKKLEFNSLLKKVDVVKVDYEENIKIVEDSTYEFSNLDSKFSVCVEYFKKSYDSDSILGLGIYSIGENYFVEMNVVKNNRFLKNILESDKYTKLTFDYKFLYVVLKKIGINIKGIVFDLLLSAYLINPQYANEDIKIVSENFMSAFLPFQDSVYKVEKKKKIPKKEKYAQYAVNKAKVVFDLEEVIINKLKKDDNYSLYEEELALSEVLGDMEINGLLIDDVKLLEVGKGFEKEAKRLTEDIYKLAGEEFNVNSFKQTGEILFEKLQLPHGRKTKTGFSTGVDVLEKLAPNFKIAEDILEYRMYNKLVTTYVNGLYQLSDDNHFIHPIYKQALTLTGRLSSIDPNIQNMPIRTKTGQVIREIFVSRFIDGYILSADYSQIELRVLAHMSEDDAMIASYKEGIDIHTRTAASIYDVPLSEVDASMRRNAKTINFGIIYGMSPWGLSESLNISVDSATKYINKYFATFSKAKKFLDQQIEDCKAKGYTITIFNRRRYIDEINSSNNQVKNFGERTAMNAPIQGSAADIIKIAMNKIDKRMKTEKVKSVMISQVHDELLFDVVSDEIEIMKKIVKEEMENAVSLKVPLIADVKVGKNWFEAK